MYLMEVLFPYAWYLTESIAPMPPGHCLGAPWGALVHIFPSEIPVSRKNFCVLISAPWTRLVTSLISIQSITRMLLQAWVRFHMVSQSTKIHLIHVYTFFNGFFKQIYLFIDYLFWFEVSHVACILVVLLFVMVAILGLFETTI